ncbi:MAG TPA: NADH-quinone oxidoreductase subunit C [Actinomycetota bacterium]|nr:NADH-quinone oxidoreductase subunit C [Actinomycetota bacterium]
METHRIPAGEWRDFAAFLAEDRWLLADLCGLDGLGLGRDPRFEIVAQFVHHDRRERVTIHVPAEGDPPTVASVTSLWATADFLEREAYDMFGIHFDGHPNLTRILMPDEWQGHPLRKDYGVGKVQVEFVPQPFMQIDTPGQATSVEAAESTVDSYGQLTEVEPRENES